MFNKKINIFIISLIIIIVSAITYFTIDSPFRRNVYNKLIGGYKLINYHMIGSDTYYRDFDSASERILKYIKFSQKFAEGINDMLPGIIESTDLITSKAYTQDEFNKMQSVYVRIDEITDDVYKNHIWLARALSDDDIEKSKKHLNKALELSKSSEEAYREIIRIFSENKEIISLMKSYCYSYFNEFGGGNVGRLATSQTDNPFFYGDNSNFAISRNGNIKKLYSRLINNLNVYNNYEFLFEDAGDFKKFYILKNFSPGSKVSIKNIVIFNNQANKLDLNKLIIHSLESYILNQNKDEVVFLTNNKYDDILKFNLMESYEQIKKITFELKLERLSLVSNSACRDLNEN